MSKSSNKNSKASLSSSSMSGDCKFGIILSAEELQALDMRKTAADAEQAWAKMRAQAERTSDLTQLARFSPQTRGRGSDASTEAGGLAHKYTDDYSLVNETERRGKRHPEKQYRITWRDEAAGPELAETAQKKLEKKLARQRHEDLRKQALASQSSRYLPGYLLPDLQEEDDTKFDEVHDLGQLLD